MNEPVHRTRATISIEAPPETVYRALTGIDEWPLLYPWIAHTEILERDGLNDRAKFWAVRPDGRTRIWTSTRTLDPVALRMVFEQQGSVGPITRLGGEWDFTPEGGGCRVESRHWFTTDQDPAETAEELDRNGARQLETLKRKTERRTTLANGVLRTEESVLLPVDQAKAHALLLETLGDAPAPHGAPQEAEFIDTALTAPDGTVHPSRALQITLAPHTLVHRHLTVPQPFELVLRVWRLVPEAGGTRLTGSRTAVIAAPYTEREPLLDWLRSETASDLRRVTDR